MARTTRISPSTDRIIEERVFKTGKSKIEINDKALESYRFKETMRLLNEEFERLRSNKNAWQQELKERQELEGTLIDGLEYD